MKTLTDIVITEGQFYAIMAGFVIWSVTMFVIGLVSGRIERRRDREIEKWINGVDRPQL